MAAFEHDLECEANRLRARTCLYADPYISYRRRMCRLSRNLTPAVTSILSAVYLKSIPGQARYTVSAYHSTAVVAVQPVRRATHASPTTIQHMRVDHGRPDILVPKQFLHSSYVVSIQAAA